MFERALVEILTSRINEKRGFIQIVMGPRQTGKSTAVNQTLKKLPFSLVQHSFDSVRTSNAQQLERKWLEARALQEQSSVVILFFDEIQMVDQWSSLVKKYWDEDTRDERDIRVILTGSSSLLIKKGLKESLAGRFEILHSTHWEYLECLEAFDYTLEEFLYFGGYPGAAQLKADENRWYDYIRNAIVEPTLTKDLIEMEDIRKPALMRALFELGASYSSQELSYRKILGQLDDKGNAATAASYLTHLSNAGLLSGIQKYSEKALAIKSSSPRLLTHDTSLMVVESGQDRQSLLGDPERKGHLVETAVGAYLLARGRKEGFNLYWWRKENKEVDFIVKKGQKRTAIEVKSGRAKGRKGLDAFLAQYPGTYCLTIGIDACKLEDFLLGKVSLFQ